MKRTLLKFAPAITSRRMGLNTKTHYATHAYKGDATDDELVEQVQELVKETKASTKKVSETAAAAELAAKSAKEMAEEAKAQTKVIAEAQAEQKARDEANQQALDGLLVEMKNIREKGIPQQGKIITFSEALADGLKDAHEDIVKVSKGRKVELDIKAGAVMTTSGDLTGSPNITYIPQPALLPAQRVNFRNLVNSFQSQTGLISLFRENNPAPAVGGFGIQATEGTLKEQVEYKYTNVQFVANYINGFVRVSKQMLQDLLFLQTYLPQELLRDYYKFENATFFNSLSTGAGTAPTGTGDNTAEKLIYNIANIETQNFAVNGITVPPNVWAQIMLTRLPSTGTSYSLPGGFMINPQTGNVEIAGVPIIKATWMPANTAIIGDWSQAQVAYVDNLKVEFFEQDSDNVQRNLITVRVECRCVLVIERPEAFTYLTGLTTP